MALSKRILHIESSRANINLNSSVVTKWIYDTTNGIVVYRNGAGTLKHILTATDSDVVDRKIHIALVSSSPQLFIERTGTSTGKWSFGVTGNKLSIRDEVAATPRMTIDASGNVGIGTTSAAGLLEIEGGSAGTRDLFRINNVSGNLIGAIYQTVTNDGVFDLINAAGSNTVRIRADVADSYITSGNFGLGTTTPSTKLEVTGNIQLSDGSERQIIGPLNQNFVINSRPNDPGEGLDLQINGTTSAFIDTNRFLALGGTSSPSTNLHLRYTTSDVITRLSNVETSLTTVQTNQLQSTFRGAGGGGNEVPGGKIVFGKEDTYNFSGNQKSFMSFYTALSTVDVERMRITSSGNVGIGTTIPTAKLQIETGTNNQLKIVAGSRVLKIEQESAGTSIITALTSSLTFKRDNSSSMFFQNLSGTNHMTITSAGTVGIGISNPSTSRLLHIHGGTVTKQLIKFTDNTTGNVGNVGSLVGVSITSADFQIWNYEAGHIRFGTADLERMRISANGRVAIGTTNNAFALEVRDSTDSTLTVIQGYNISTGTSAGTAIVSTANGNNAQMIAYSDAHSTKANVVEFGTKAPGSRTDFITNTGTKMTINDSGNVGIGTTNPVDMLNIVRSTNSIVSLGITNTNGGGTSNSVGINGSADGNNFYIRAYGDSHSVNANTIEIGSTAGLTAIRLVTAGTTKMTILDTGNVGIGITLPTSDLHISTGSSSTFGLGNSQLTYTSGGGGLLITKISTITISTLDTFSGLGGTGNGSMAAFSGDINAAGNIKATGKLGIGTNPAVALDILDGGVVVLQALNDSATPTLNIGPSTTRTVITDDAITIGSGSSAPASVALNFISTSEGKIVYTNTANQMLFYCGGSIITRYGVGSVEFFGLPTTNPGGSNKVWNDAGVLKIT